MQPWRVVGQGVGADPRECIMSTLPQCINPFIAVTNVLITCILVLSFHSYFYLDVKIFKPSEYTVIADAHLGRGGFGDVVRGNYCGPIAVKKMKASVTKEILDAEICTA